MGQWDQKTANYFIRKQLGQFRSSIAIDGFAGLQREKCYWVWPGKGLPEWNRSGQSSCSCPYSPSPGGWIRSWSFTLLNDIELTAFGGTFLWATTSRHPERSRGVYFKQISSSRCIGTGTRNDNLRILPIFAIITNSYTIKLTVVPWCTRPSTLYRRGRETQ